MFYLRAERWKTNIDDLPETMAVLSVLLLSNESTFPLPVPPASDSESLISDEAFYYFNAYVVQMSLSLISSVGIAANVTNVVVFSKHVPRDGVTLTFIFLSVTDAIGCTFALLSIGCFVLQGHLPISGVNLWAVQYVYLGYTRGCAYVISTCLTCYLSIERCFCILFPLSVKLILNGARSVIIKVSLIVFGLACFAPAWSTQGLQEVFDPLVNETHLDLWLASCRRDVDIFVDTFNGAVLPTLAQIILTISAVIIVRGLKASARFRQLCSGTTAGLGKSETFASREIEAAPPTVMTSKEARAAKVVVLVAVIFFACNVPVLVVAYVRLFVPELDFGKLYYKLYTVLYTVVYACGLVNASVNIIVYSAVSAKFKAIFLSLVCGSPAIAR
ncbi:hypothetical protein Btru_075701 [Bulinus truncatus]|nr:hypothetical protein Btru_075701 [Bulinus truncatus]